MKHTVIIHPKRFYTFVILCILLMALGLTFIFSFLSEKSSSAASVKQKETIVVRAGDTVWHLAEPVARRNGKDIRDIVREIYRINQLGSSGIHPGQTLCIPLR